MAGNPTSSQRPSAAVYRRRRIVVLVVVLLVVGLLIWLISWAIGALGNLIGGPDVDEPQVSATTTAGPDASGSGEAAPACDAADVAVVAATAAETFSVNDSEAILELEITNTSDAACSTNVGTTMQEFLITSGSDRIFSSKDCQVEPEDHELVLEPDSRELARFGWQLNRSMPECAEVAATPQPGTYKLTVKLGEIESDPVTFYLQ